MFMHAIILKCASQSAALHRSDLGDCVQSTCHMMHVLSGGCLPRHADCEQRGGKKKVSEAETKCSANQSNHTGLSLPQQVCGGGGMALSLREPTFSLTLTPVPAVNHTEEINAESFR